MEKLKRIKTNQGSILLVLGFLLFCFRDDLSAQGLMKLNQPLDSRLQSIVVISVFTAKGDLSSLKKALRNGLDSGLTVNQIKEVIVHLYAYCGFPRSIRGLQTLMETLEERKAKGTIDKTGADVSPINKEGSKYERGKRILGELTKTQQADTLIGYSAFAPVIDTFLKEHLFSDIFERTVLTYSERELVTVSVLSSIGGAQPMLRSHLQICLNVGLTAAQLHQFTESIGAIVGKKEGQEAKNALDEILKKNKP